MSLCRWKLFHYSLPLTEPLYLLGHKMHERTGLILRLHDENDGTSVGDNYGEGEIAPRRSKKGRTFYGCTKYPDCKFTSWDKPNGEACPECKNPFLVEKWKKNEDPSVVCPNCGFKKTNVAA